MTEPVILLVEDNEDDVELARIALARAKFPHHLRVARDGVEAIAYLLSAQARKDPPALVLLDLNLPRQDGKTVLRELRGDPLTARVPVVVLTSSRLEVDVLDAYALGANSFYQKPTDLEEFSTDTTILLAYWFQYNVAPYRIEGKSIGELSHPVDVFLEPEGKRTPEPGGPMDVVVIDCHADDRAATVRALESVTAPRTIVQIATFDDAAELLRRFRGPPPFLVHDSPRLVFVDLDLAGGDGRDLLQAIRFRCDHHVLLVVFTRKVTAELVSECYRLKINSLVRKPDDEAEYRSTVRLICHYWLCINARPPPPGKEGPQTPRPG